MKTITAIIRPTKFPDVRDALNSVGIEMLTVNRVMGCGRKDTSASATVAGEENLLNKTRIEIMVADHLVKKTVDAIMRKSRTGAQGDGKIFVMDVPQFQNISAAALS
jgi:nitrogen regulatory protein P-II 1